MAQLQGVLLDQDQFCCSICLDLLKEPVALPCGHSYCRSCIEGCWYGSGWRQYGQTYYRCPQCRERFHPRPVLRKNNMLAEVVEKLRKSRPSATVVYAGPADVACDFCPGTRRPKALMCCLVCLGSYCDTHLQPHYSVPVLQKHKLVPATNKLQEKMCSHHDKLKEVFCRTDQQCVCYMCAMDEHKGHDTVSAAAEKTVKQKQLGTVQQRIQQEIQERKKELNDLRWVMLTLKISAEAAVFANGKIFAEMIVSIMRRQDELEGLIRDQQETAGAPTEGHLRQLEEEIATLERRHADLGKLSNTDDDIHFIQSFQSISRSSGSPALPSVVACRRGSFTGVSDAVSGLRDQLDHILKTTWPEVSKRVSAVDVHVDLHLSPQPQSREDFLQYSCPFSLDLDTMHKNLTVSKNNRKITATQQQKRYKDNPERFTIYWQVLCREGLSDRSYWEVEWSGSDISIAVSYKNINRKEYNVSFFGYNDDSWSLTYSAEGYMFRHNKVDTKVFGPCSSRVGVYLDHKAGTLSFFCVSDKMTPLHTFQTTFTQPLYPGLRLYDWGDTAVVCKTW